MLVSELIDKVQNEWLYPSGVDRPTFDVLAADIASGDLTITLEGRVGRVPGDGLLEIEDELVLVEGTSGSVVTANERGFANTDPAAHTAGTRVTIDPKYPRKTIRSALDAVTALLYPWGVYRRVLDTALDYDPSDPVVLPADTLDVLRVSVRAISGREIWRRLKMEGRDWEFLDEFDPPLLHVYRGTYSGADLQLVLAKDFTRGLTSAQDLTTDGGIPGTMVEQLPMAVAGHILQSREIPRVQIDEVRRLLAQQGIQVGSALNVGQAMLNHFRTTAVLAERRRLNLKDEPHFTWVRS